MDFIIAAADEATRALLREQLGASVLGRSPLGTAAGPAELADRLAAARERPSDTLVVTAQGTAGSEEFMRLALSRGSPVLIWPLPGRPSPGRQLRRLSAREREILSLVAAGVSNKGIARALQVSPNTVKFHLNALFSKLAVNTRAEAIAAAARSGDLSL